MKFETVTTGTQHKRNCYMDGTLGRWENEKVKDSSRFQSFKNTMRKWQVHEDDLKDVDLISLSLLRQHVLHQHLPSTRTLSNAGICSSAFKLGPKPTFAALEFPSLEIAVAK